MVLHTRTGNGGPWLGTLAFRAMGCQADLWFVAEEVEPARQALMGTWAFIQTAEAVLIAPASPMGELADEGSARGAQRLGPRAPTGMSESPP